MVKIERVFADSDDDSCEIDHADSDDDCCEIDPAEFASKVQLKVSESEDVILLTSKGQIKVEEDCHDTDANTICLDISDSDNDLDLHQYAAGDRMDCPYEIDEDEATLCKVDGDEDKCRANNVQKSQQLLTDESRVFDEEDDDDFVVVGRDALWPGETSLIQGTCANFPFNKTSHESHCPKFPTLRRIQMCPREKRIRTKVSNL
uniref:Uncharacterized protein n=1 Tax=Leersia perrieri TaxID=77586 RepID=A0A0D9XMT7_9ORYZ